MHESLNYFKWKKPDKIAHTLLSHLYKIVGYEN